MASLFLVSCFCFYWVGLFITWLGSGVVNILIITQDSYCFLIFSTSQSIQRTCGVKSQHDLLCCLWSLFALQTSCLYYWISIHNHLLTADTLHQWFFFLVWFVYPFVLFLVCDCSTKSVSLCNTLHPHYTSFPMQLSSAEVAFFIQHFIT